MLEALKSKPKSFIHLLTLFAVTEPLLVMMAIFTFLACNSLIALTALAIGVFPK